jgi:hypothetical protein
MVVLYGIQIAPYRLWEFRILEEYSVRRAKLAEVNAFISGGCLDWDHWIFSPIVVVAR